MLDKFSSGAQRIISIAEALAFEFNHPSVGSEHLLLSFLKCKDNIISKELAKKDLDFFNFKSKIQSLYSEDEDSVYIQYTFELKEILANSLKYSDKNKEGLISVDSLALSLLSHKSVAYELLVKEGINISSLIKIINNSRKKKSELSSLSDLHILGMNNKDPLIGRDEEISQLINALSRRNKPNAILVGEPGVGKSAIVEEVAKRLLDNKIPSLKGKVIYELDIASTVSGTKYRGEFEEKIKKIIKKVQEDGNAILFIDEIHTIVKAGGAEGAIDASNILKPYLSRGEIQIVGATTEEEFNQSFEKDKALKRRFQLIKVDETSEEETLNILLKIKTIYEKFYHIKIDNYLLEKIVSLASSYILNQKFPDKAIDLLDNSCVIAKNNLKEEDIFLTLKNYYKVITKYSKIQKLEENLKNNLIGQDRVIDEIIDEFKLIDLGYVDKNKPLGVFVFEGPSGCGKTKCCEIIASSYFSLSRTLVLNMNTYRDLNAISRLISSSSTYLESTSLLVKTLSNNPNSLIVLDHFDKATNEVKEFFFDLFERGFFYDNKGNKINCTNAIFILKSTVFDNKYGIFKKYITNDGKITEEQNNSKISNENIARINKIFTFDGLNKGNIEKILNKFVKERELEFETSLIDEAINLSEEDEYKQKGVSLGIKNLKRKIIEKNKVYK